MRHQDDVLLLRLLLLHLGLSLWLSTGSPYPQGQQQESADSGDRGRDLNARTAKTKRDQRTMAGG